MPLKRYEKLNSRFALEHRYGYDCRNRGFQHLVRGEDKPVGMAYDNATRTLFWSNDVDSPHQSNTSWITSMNVTNTSTLHKIRNQTVDPQGMYVCESSFQTHDTHTHTTKSGMSRKRRRNFTSRNIRDIEYHVRILTVRITKFS